MTLAIVIAMQCVGGIGGKCQRVVDILTSLPLLIIHMTLVWVKRLVNKCADKGGYKIRFFSHPFLTTTAGLVMAECYCVRLGCYDHRKCNVQGHLDGVIVQLGGRRGASSSSSDGHHCKGQDERLHMLDIREEHTRVHT